MSTATPLLLVLDLVGIFAFALNGALVAVRAERLDVFGIVTVGMFTALGGGVIRDVLLDALPRPRSSIGDTSHWQREAD